MKIIKRKTLQLDFERLGSGEVTDPSGIRWTGNATWMYRASTEPLKVVKEKDEAAGDKKPVVGAPRLEPIPTVPVKRIRD